MHFPCTKALCGFLIFFICFASGCVKIKGPVAPQASQVEPLLGKKESKGIEDSKEKGAIEEHAGKAEAPSLSSSEQAAEKWDQVLRQFQKGTRLLEMGESDQARILFEALRDEYPDVSVFYINLGVAYKRLERDEDAIQSYRQAIKVSDFVPGHADAHYNLGILLREQGDFKGAEKAYLTALSVSPEFQDAHFNLAVLYDLFLNEPEKAIHHYQKHKTLTGEVNEEIDLWVSALQKRLNNTGGAQ